MNKKIVLLCTDCYSTTALYNYITKEYPIDSVIIEQPLRGVALAKRRFRRLGFFRVCGQIAFSLMVVPIVSWFGKKRVKEIQQVYGFDQTNIPEQKTTRFDTVNDEDCITLLEKINPGIVLVNGTRTVSYTHLTGLPYWILPLANSRCSITILLSFSMEKYIITRK